MTAPGDKQGSSFFLDLDTGSRPKLPPSVPAADGSDDNIQKAITWARGKGADLACVSYGNDQKRPYVLRGLGMQLWEISPLDAKNISKRLQAGELPTGRQIDDGLLLHYDPETKQLAPKIGSSFFVSVQRRWLGNYHGDRLRHRSPRHHRTYSTPKGVGFYRGVRFDWKTIVR